MYNAAYYVGKPVTSLQTMLRTVAAQDPTLPAPIPDGIYGSQTVHAVAAFQRKHGLPPTGITDDPTWQAVAAAFEAALPAQLPAAPLWMALGQPLAEGSANLHLPLIQAMLHTLSQLYSNLPDCSICGHYEQSTAAAVKALQSVCQLPQTGRLDRESWDMLSSLYTQAVGDGRQAPAETAAPLITEKTAPLPQTVQVHSARELYSLGE